MLQHNQTGANFMNLIFTVTDVVCLTSQNFQARLILAGEARGAIAMVHPLVRISKMPHLANKPPEKKSKGTNTPAYFAAVSDEKKFHNRHQESVFKTFLRV